MGKVWYLTICNIILLLSSSIFFILIHISCVLWICYLKPYKLVGFQTKPPSALTNAKQNLISFQLWGALWCHSLTGLYWWRCAGVALRLLLEDTHKKVVFSVVGPLMLYYLIWSLSLGSTLVIFQPLFCLWTKSFSVISPPPQSAKCNFETVPKRLVSRVPQLKSPRAHMKLWPSSAAKGLTALWEWDGELYTQQEEKILLEKKILRRKHAPKFSFFINYIICIICCKHASTKTKLNISTCIKQVFITSIL